MRTENLLPKSPAPIDCSKRRRAVSNESAWPLKGPNKGSLPVQSRNASSSDSGSTSGVNDSRISRIRKEGVLQLDLIELRSQVSPKEYGTLLGRVVFREDVRDKSRQVRRTAAESVAHRGNVKRLVDRAKSTDLGPVAHFHVIEARDH